MNKRWPLILTLLVATACSKSREPNSLSDRVDFACDLLTNDLAKAAEKYREYAGWMAGGRLSPDQQGRAEIDLQYGTTDRERRVAGYGVHMQLRMCAMTRDIDDNRSDAYLTRAGEVVGRFIWGTNAARTLFLEVTDPAQMATSLEELAGLAAEINAVPIRD